MKKSTDSHCAMKIQLKTAMLDCFSDDPKRIDHERRVLASVHHPFILGLQYAFQTETLAILVLEMVTCGDLQEALDKSGSNGLGEERAAFYCAEIILALIHLHDMGLMYRDLKPCNVMLCDDGHIKLADMGGVAEFAEGTVLEDYDPSDVSSTPYSTVVGTLKQQSTNEDLQHKRRHRRRSIMGTHGYMAPEMVILANQPRSVRKGYTKSVDYWSLGVTLYKFLTTVRPFDRKAFEAFVQDPDCRMGKGFQKYQDILDAMRYPIPVTDAAHSVIVGLLQGNEHERLGCTPELLKALRSHPFFCGIDWVKLSMRQVIPPYIPEPRQLNENPTVPDFKTLMKEYEAQSKSGKRHADEFNWAEAPRQSDQVYFSNWDYVSMHTLKIEMGIANEMRELDNNLKVRIINSQRTCACYGSRYARSCLGFTNCVFRHTSGSKNGGVGR
jgi:serine/threonine protein kinase